jgi:hypothetical protein
LSVLADLLPLIHNERAAIPLETERTVKQFLITYRVKDGLEDRRRQEIAAFIAAIDADPELRGRVSYLCMKRSSGPEYYHIATVTDDAAVGLLQSRPFFSRYTAETELAADGEVEVSPLEVIAQTSAAAPAVPAGA